MKILQMHCDFIEYKPIKKEIQGAEESATDLVRVEEVLVLFTAVERGDDAETGAKAMSEAKDFLLKLGAKKVMVYPFAHISQNLARPVDALPVLAEMEAVAKKGGLEVYRAPFGWNKSLQVKVKGHPLAEMSRSYGSMAAEDIPKVLPQKERHEMSEHEMLARIKKSDFAGLPDTDHRILGEKLDLFSFQEPSPGMVYWHDKGVTLRNILMEFIRSEQKKGGYIEISNPSLANTVLWKVSGHYDHYKDDMFFTQMGEEQFGLKPMNCPSTFLFYKTRKWSYKDLPLRVADFDTLYRNELSGVASGLFRLKSFVQDDAHIFVTDDQIVPEIEKVIDLMARFYGIFGLKYTPKVSTMPDNHLGTVEQWNAAVEALVKAVKAKGIEPVMKEKEGAFYGPKIDVDVKDSMGRDWQCATIQLDFQMPARFKLTYTGQDGQEHTPAVIHRVIYGSVERFIGIVLEHFKGRLPLWISPVQVEVIPISDDQRAYAESTLKALKDAGIRAEGDLQPGTMGAKIRSAQLRQVPLMVVVGDKEVASSTLSVRDREGHQTLGLRLEDFVHQTKEKSARFE